MGDYTWGGVFDAAREEAEHERRAAQMERDDARNVSELCDRVESDLAAAKKELDAARAEAETLRRERDASLAAEEAHGSWREKAVALEAEKVEWMAEPPSWMMSRIRIQRELTAELEQSQARVKRLEEALRWQRDYLLSDGLEASFGDDEGGQREHPHTEAFSRVQAALAPPNGGGE